MQNEYRNVRKVTRWAHEEEESRLKYGTLRRWRSRRVQIAWFPFVEGGATLESMQGDFWPDR